MTNGEHGLKNDDDLPPYPLPNVLFRHSNHFEDTLMRTIIAVIALILFLSSCRSDEGPVVPNPELKESLHGKTMTLPDTASVPDSIMTAFTDDAYRIVQDYQYKNPVFSNRYDIPEEYMRTVLNGLLHIYLSASKERDTVISIYRIHRYNRNNRVLFLNMDTSNILYQHWASNSNTSGVYELDTFLTGISMSVNMLRNDQGVIIQTMLKAQRPLNLDLVISYFSTLFRSRQWAGSILVPITDGPTYTNNLTMIWTTTYANRIVYRFIVGSTPFEDYGNREYVFAVLFNGTVQFLGAHGIAPPYPN
jgi:hypothetical protein